MKKLLLSFTLLSGIVQTTISQYKDILDCSYLQEIENKYDEQSSKFDLYGCIGILSSATALWRIVNKLDSDKTVFATIVAACCTMLTTHTYLRMNELKKEREELINKLKKGY